MYTNSKGEAIDLSDGTVHGVPLNTTMQIAYAWAIPEDIREQIKKDDYFEFDLPGLINPISAVNGKLEGKNGNNYADYSIYFDNKSEKWKVKFVFTDQVENESNIKGDLNFQVKLDKEQIKETGPITIEFPKEDKLEPFDVYVRPNTSTEISKDGHFDRVINPNKVYWDVTFNQGQRLRDTPVITETFPTGLKYESVVVKKVTMNLDGTIKEVGAEVPKSDYTVADKGNVTIHGKTRDTYRLEYVTLIEDSSKPDDGGSVNFNNKVTLNDKIKPEIVGANKSLAAKYKKRVEKSISG